jgi:hypothetical protein
MLRQNIRHVLPLGVCAELRTPAFLERNKLIAAAPLGVW